MDIKVIPLLSTKDIERFESKIVKTDDCYAWTAHCIKGGYGIISIQRNIYLAHRIAYYIKDKNFDQTLHVLHKCDNPSCVKFDHLFLGSHEDNMKDMSSKGRARSVPKVGKHNGMAKFNFDTISNIRSDFKSDNYSRWDLVRKYNISKSHLDAVLINKYRNVV